MGSTLPYELTAFVDHVVPILQRKGRFRTEYAGTTLRGHLGLSRPSAPLTGYSGMTVSLLRRFHSRRHAAPKRRRVGVRDIASISSWSTTT